MKSIFPIKSKLFALFFGSFLFILLIIVGGTFIYWQLQITPPQPGSKAQATFVIAKGEGVSSIANRLLAQDFIKNDLIFKILVKANRFEQKIQAGSYLLSSSMDIKTIIQTLTKGTFDVWVTIPEGLRKEEIAQKLREKIEINQQEFIQTAKEGYLFPDTYLIPKDYTAGDVIKLMEDNYQKKIASLSQPVTSEDLILASIVEREAMHETDRPIVAGILKKRVTKDWGMEADATVQYALGYDNQEKSWWKKNLTVDDLQIDSPYNTRKFVGYPPTPICSPGLATLKAAINPQETKYWYYLSDKQGTMHYAVTLEEHNENVRKYLSG